jgi:hypothetical protein
MHHPIPLKLSTPAQKQRPLHSKLWRHFLPGLALACFAVPSQGEPVDGTLFTSYGISTDHTTVSWVVCGSTKDTEGCYDSGHLGPFGSVGALLESAPLTGSPANTVAREIYVLDVAGGASQTEVNLYVYTKTDIVSASSDKTVVVLKDTIGLPLAGGTTAQASMAANQKFLFVGTDQTPYAVIVAKKGFAVTQTGGFDPAINVTAITGDPYGYVTVTFGTFASGNNGFYVYGPNGMGQEDGGGATFMLNTIQAVLPSTFH